MRVTKVIAFSMPPDLEALIQEHALLEHRTISEYMREAVRQYMKLTGFLAPEETMRSKRMRHSAKHELPLESLELKASEP